MPDNESADMASRLARENNFLILSFTQNKSSYRTGIQNDTVRVKDTEHWFFQVKTTNTLRLRPFNLGPSIAAFKSQVEGVEEPWIEPEEGIGPVPLIDTQGNDVLRNDEDDWFVYHYTVAPMQEDIRVYPQIPDSQPGGVFRYLGARQPSSQLGSPIGYADGNDNPEYYEPQGGILENLVWDTGETTPVEYQFFNSNSQRRKIPKLNIFGAGYVLAPITEDVVKRNLLVAASNNDNSVTQLTWGPIRDTFSYELPDSWEDVGNSLIVKSPLIPSSLRDENTFYTDEI
jgi:hypothetical protein